MRPEFFITGRHEEGFGRDYSLHDLSQGIFFPSGWTWQVNSSRKLGDSLMESTPCRILIIARNFNVCALSSFHPRSLCFIVVSGHGFNTTNIRMLLSPLGLKRLGKMVPAASGLLHFHVEWKMNMPGYTNKGQIRRCKVCEKAQLHVPLYQLLQWWDNYVDLISWEELLLGHVMYKNC